MDRRERCARTPFWETWEWSAGALIYIAGIIKSFFFSFFMIAARTKDHKRRSMIHYYIRCTEHAIRSQSSAGAAPWHAENTYERREQRCCCSR